LNNLLAVSRGILQTGPWNLLKFSAENCGPYTLPRSLAPMDFISACAAGKRHQQSVAVNTYRSDSHARIHLVHKLQHWQRDWTRDQCVMVAQLCTSHSLLLAGYLQRIGRRDSATCSHCSGTDETAEHLLLKCSAHDQARRDIWQ